MQTSMTGRPRPVTATVTKPKWMQIPNPDAMDKIRRKSFESTGSTASLTSLLDHDSYNSENDKEQKTESLDDTYSLKDNVKVTRKVRTLSGHQQKTTKECWEPRSRTPSPSKPRSSNNILSAWEQWVIHKAKDERRKHQEERKKKKEERLKQEQLEQDKQKKLQKAEIVRQQWTEMKEKENIARKKEEKERKIMAKNQKEAADAEIKSKAEKKYAEWMDMKKEEEKLRRQQMKEEKQKIKQHEETRKQAAERRFQEWLKQANKRPKSAPNSYGYLSGKMTGYHDRSAYPQPSFYNPLPWHPPAVPNSSQKAEKPRKAKTKPYKWNPDKYF